MSSPPQNEQPEGQSSKLVQGFAQVPLLSPTLSTGQQKPLEQLPLQQSLEVLQVPPSEVHAAAHVPVVLSQLPLQH